MEKVECGNCGAETTKGKAPLVVVAGWAFEALCKECWMGLAKSEQSNPFAYRRLNEIAKRNYLASKAN